MFKFITHRPFWINLLAAIFLAFLLLFVTLQLLGWITKHGAYLTVPAVIAKDTKKSIQLLESKGFEVVIQDSIYTDTLAQGTVIKQLPDPNATVKINRTVYLTVNRYTPPLIEMPSLEGKSLSFALDLLDRNHLKLEDTIYKPDFMKGSILEQQFNGAKITAGSKLPWGSRITLIVASGLDDQQIIVPDLLGKTLAEARLTLEENGINIGAVIADATVTDTAAAFVYKQNPDRLDEESQPRYIRSGQLMDVWISQQMIYLKDSTEQTSSPKDLKNKKNTEE